MSRPGAPSCASRRGPQRRHRRRPLFFWTANVFADTAQLRAVGGFDGQFRAWGAEDVDLGYRLYRGGAHFTFNRRAKALHIPHAEPFEALLEEAASNYRYMTEKCSTPLMRVLAELPPRRFLDFTELAAAAL
ncbi:galactosyltransferase-related protein [Micromonospora sp. NPDC003944]